MTRTTLPDRRQCINKVVIWTTNGQQRRFHVSVGFEGFGDGKESILEVFYADGMKEGQDLHLIAQDACVLVSLLLQHGVEPKDIAKSLSSAPVLGISRPASIVGAIVEAISK